MKAIILAAGYATRLYPLTKNIPKPLFEVGGKAIIDHVVEKMQEVPHIDEIFVVTNDKFHSHFMAWKEENENLIKTTIVNDGTTCNEDRLGSLGDIRYVIEEHKLHEHDLIVVAGDNLFSFSLNEKVASFHCHKKTQVALYDVGDYELAKLYGIVSVDENNKVVFFEEKPEKPQSTLISTGVYIYPASTIPKLIEFTDQFETDRAGDFIAWLHKEEDVYGFHTNQEWFDIGTLEQLEEARKFFI